MNDEGSELRHRQDRDRMAPRTTHVFDHKDGRPVDLGTEVLDRQLSPIDDANVPELGIVLEELAIAAERDFLASGVKLDSGVNLERGGAASDTLPLGTGPRSSA